jgi:glycosyltransferase involved in cell wall biosynthesis
MKKVLIIAHSFPPIGGSGTFRTLKFVKFLPDYNWMSYILTTNERYSEKKDFSMLSEVPDSTKIFRTLIFSPFRIFVKLIAQLKSLKKSNITTKSHDTANKNKNEGFKTKTGQRLITYWQLLDGYNEWLPFAIIKGLFVIRKYKIDVIYSTSPIHMSQVIGLLLHKMTGLKWIADFRDPWVIQESLRSNYPVLFLKFEKFLESLVVKNSNFIICNTLRLLDKFKNHYSNCDSSKFVYIPNGYDPDDFKLPVKKITPFPQFTITHTGEFYQKGRTPDSFLIAVSELIKSGKIKANEIKVIFVGGGEYSESSEFKEFLKKNILEDVVELIYHLPHEMSIEYLYKSSVLLLLQPGKDFILQVPAKVFEYAYLLKPILTIAPEGSTADFISTLNYGFVVDPDDISEMKIKIFECYELFKSNKLQKITWSPTIDKYNRKNLTQDLINLFKD